MIKIKIDKNIISLFNNSRDETIDLTNYSYSIDTSPSISINGSILPQQSFNIILSTTLPDSCQIKLFNNLNLLHNLPIIHTLLLKSIKAIVKLIIIIYPDHISL